MRVIIQDSAAEVASVASEQIAEVVRAKRAASSRAVLGVATGSSPLGTYAALADRVRAG
ncbi:MAG: glucosamine-6-phosphate deaminase, partial [Actinomycetales bacterium]|nr:glucosamine-6-phosphate deaminase [Actinomycetales bacterium]